MSERGETPRSTARDLYLDLLTRILTNTIYEDASIDRTRFDGATRREGRDWPAVAHTMVGKLRLQNLRELVQRVLDEDIPGHLIETGVWRGGCCILMRGVLAANDVNDRKVFVADSFKGLPPPRLPEDAGDIHHRIKVLAVPEEEVRLNFEKYGLLDDSIVFVKGLFQDTLKNLDAVPFALMRLDGDMYESTWVALEQLYPRLSPRGFVIIDDYGAIESCRRAVTDFRTKNAIHEPMHEIDWTGVWWQKSQAETAKA
jgi:O-methyltransferase